MLRRLARAARYLPNDVRLAGPRFWWARHFGGAGELTVRPRELQAPIVLRAVTRDPQVLWYVLRGRDQLPPPGLRPRSILDLGANIGIAAALFASLFPDARILCVEPDHANAALARRNLAAWASRCEVVEGAAWPTDTTLALTGAGTDALRVAEDGGDVAAIPIGELVRRAEVDGVVDYVKMNVEGAERELLRDASWAEHVRAIRVEVHPPYTTEACSADLSRAGFIVPAALSGSWVTGLKP